MTTVRMVGAFASTERSATDELGDIPLVNGAPLPRRVVQRPYSLDLEHQPFVASSIEALAGIGVEAEAGTVWDLLTSPPTVLHVHWPDFELGQGFRGRVRSLAFLAAIERIRRRGGRLVYTAHNAAPHDRNPSRFHRYFLKRFDQCVDDVVVMSEAGAEELLDDRPGLMRARRHHVRHGDFVHLLAEPIDRSKAKELLGVSPDRNLVLFAGRIRRYKGVTDLLRAAEQIDVDVLVVGQCGDPELRDEIDQLAAANPRAVVRYDFLSNAELSVHLSAADLVVLPYRRVLNSGAAILALSATRRALVPSTPTFDELATEVGPGWVPRYNELLTPDTLAEVLAAGDPPNRPDLSLYGWHTIATSLRAIYAAGSTIPLRNAKD